MHVDYIRVYQPKNAINYGCDPVGFPTSNYINQYIEAYTNPNITVSLTLFPVEYPFFLTCKSEVGRGLRATVAKEPTCGHLLRQQLVGSVFFSHLGCWTLFLHFPSTLFFIIIMRVMGNGSSCSLHPPRPYVIVLPHPRPLDRVDSLISRIMERYLQY